MLSVYSTSPKFDFFFKKQAKPKNNQLSPQNPQKCNPDKTKSSYNPKPGVKVSAVPRLLTLPFPVLPVAMVEQRDEERLVSSGE